LEGRLAELKGEIDNSTMIAGDFNTPLAIMGRTIQSMINKETEHLTNSINPLELTNSPRTLH
jgi:hypothetical protein